MPYNFFDQIETATDYSKNPQMLDRPLQQYRLVREASDRLQRAVMKLKFASLVLRDHGTENGQALLTKIAEELEAPYVHEDTAMGARRE